MPDKKLPEFASQWIQQWKQAGPALQAVRDQELRQLGGAPSGFAAGHRVFDRHPERHGMVIMQRWLMRQALLDAQALQNECDRRSS